MKAQDILDKAPHTIQYSPHSIWVNVDAKLTQNVDADKYEIRGID